MTTTIIRVPNMNCGGCQSTIESELAKIADAQLVAVELDAKKLTLSWSQDATWPAIVAAIEGAGFRVEQQSG
mgnify:CR=1 FL=1